MGVVYRAEDPHLRREVALKVMLPEYAADAEARARFIREARAQAKVEHDHVAAIFQVGESGGVPFIAMPLLKGLTLHAALKANARPPLNAVVRMGKELAEGLAAAHEQGLIHRDIKPSNIWLEGKNLRVKILDFGLARVMETEEGPDGPLSHGTSRVSGAFDEEQLTRTGATVGTPSYMSPEQAKGQPVDHRSDLFSLGVVLYQMATGQRPFVGPAAYVILDRVMEYEPPPVRTLVPSVPVGLSDLIARLLAKEPAARPVSASAVAEELRQIELAMLGQVRVVALDSVLSDSHASSREPDPFAEIEATEASTTSRSPARSPSSPWWLWSVAGLAGVGGVALAVFLAWPAPKKPELVEEKPVPRKERPKGTEREPVRKSDPPKDRDRDWPPLTRVPEYGIRLAAGESIDIPELRLPNGGDLTIEAFVTPMNPLAQTAYAVGVNGLAYLSLFENGHWRWYTFHGEDDSPKPFVNHRTVHVAGVRTAKERRLYLDGRRIASSTDQTEKQDQATEPFRIGGVGFAGIIAEVHVSKAARYDLDFVPEPRVAPDGNTLALYHLDEGAGDVVKDSSGNNRHAKFPVAKWQSDKIPADPDRVAAEWSLANGAAATVVVDGRIMNIASAEQLPQKPFQVQTFNCNRNPRANDETLRCLRGLRNLVTVQITNCAATDRTLTYLKDSKDLEVLVLYATGVTDEGLKTLEGFSALKSLNLTQLPQVTETGVRNLAAKLPQCAIVWAGGTINPSPKP
jgi:serine/threonine protein kinase